MYPTKPTPPQSSLRRGGEERADVSDVLDQVGSDVLVISSILALIDVSNHQGRTA